MKKLLLLILIPLCTLSLFGHNLRAQPEWNNLSMYRSGKLQPHDRIIPEGDWLRSLNGTWQFRYFESPAALDTDRLSYWDTIHVPGNIELQGYGVPVYVNMRNEFPSHPPQVPAEYNPVGLYRRTFTIPSHWQGRRVIIKFGAVKSAMYLAVNGHTLGYSEDSKTPAEWDITRYLRPGENEVQVRVVRWCNGSYLECQDMWRMSGITRNVELYCVPLDYIADLRVIADLDTSDYRTARLDLMIDLNRRMGGGHLEVDICGRTYSQRLLSKDWFVMLMPEVGEVEPWTDSTPTLYPLTLRLYNAEGTLLETLCKRIGFRHIDIRHSQLLLNGKPMEIRGVNRHEHSATGGHYVCPDEMRQDVAMMKQMGINAVRTSHYPNDELWYDLCDSAGIYIWDEANVESHAQGYGDEALPKHPEWREPILDRIYNMYRRDRNHPSVIAWSLGNESGNGPIMEEAYRLMKERDATRPTVYERALSDPNSDLYMEMYPSVEAIGEYARSGKDKRPYIIAEYCHAMGNSMGGLQDYWDTIRHYPQLQGGFVWDWVDQAFPAPRGWAAGGDFGQLFGIKDDDNFCANGILAADRQPHPCAAEVEAVYTHGRSNICVPMTDSIALTHRADHLRTERNDKQHRLRLQGSKFRLDINTLTGEITSYRYRGHELLAVPLHPNFWRPPTDNDLCDRLGARAWQGLDQLTPQVASCTEEKGLVVMNIIYHAPDGSRLRVKQIIEMDEAGRLQLSYAVSPDGQFRTLPKLGLQLGLDTAFTACAFYGNIHESYPDRRTAQRVGRWYKSLAELAAPQYVVPQEQGNREAIWVRFVGEGQQLRVLHSGAERFHFSVRHASDSALTAARRWWQVADDPFYTISLDHAVAPLGTATCGPSAAEHYTLSGDSVYTYSFTLDPTPSSQLTLFQAAPLSAETEATPAIASFSAPIAATTSLTASMPPTETYAAGFPTVLHDGRRAVAGDYRHGWNGWQGIDTLLLTLTLAAPTHLGEVELGSCHSPTDWVLAPISVEAQWSRDGLKWSAWQPLSAANSTLPTHRCRYILQPRKAKRIRYVRFRIATSATLPLGHDYAGSPAWLMLDEVQVRTAK